MDQGVINAYKSYYTQNICRHGIHVVDFGAFINLKQNRLEHSVGVNVMLFVTVF